MAGTLKLLNRKYPKVKGGKISVNKMGVKKQNKYSEDNLYCELKRMNSLKKIELKK